MSPRGAQWGDEMRGRRLSSERLAPSGKLAPLDHWLERRGARAPEGYRAAQTVSLLSERRPLGATLIYYPQAEIINSSREIVSRS